jgi:hypothetical protein
MSRHKWCHDRGDQDIREVHIGPFRGVLGLYKNKTLIFNPEKMGTKDEDES